MRILKSTPTSCISILCLVFALVFTMPVAAQVPPSGGGGGGGGGYSESVVKVELIGSDYPVYAGAKNITLGGIQITNNTGKPLVPTTIVVSLKVEGLQTGYIGNPMIKDNYNNPIPITKDSKIHVRREGLEARFCLSEQATIPPRAMVIYWVTCDTDENVTDGTTIMVSLSLPSGLKFAQSHGKILPGDLYGPTITVKQAGRLNILTDVTTPEGSRLLPNSTDNSVLRFKVQSTGESAKIWQIYISYDSPPPWFDRVTVYRGAEFLGEADMYYYCAALTLAEPITVPADSSAGVVFTVKVDTTENTGGPFAVYVTEWGITALGETSGVILPPATGGAVSDEFMVEYPAYPGE